MMPTVLVITTGEQSFREYLLASISTRYRVHLLLGHEPTWERGYIAGWTVLGNLGETIDATEMIAAAEAVAARESVQGVLTWDEGRVLQAAKVAAALGLPGGDPEAAMRCRDKHQTRLALAAAGVAQPQSLPAASIGEALVAAEKIGYPVVLKPRAMAASLGVVRVDGPAELAANFAFAREATVPGAWRYDEVLVEEHVPGPEISVDSAVHGGEVFPMFVARKEVGFAPYFEELGHLVDAVDPLLFDPVVRRVVRNAHAALGFTDGMTHVELKLTPTGPKVIEVNARIGGGLVPYLGMRASGIDPGLVAAGVSCGERPELRADRSGVGAVRFFYPRKDMAIEALEIDRSTLPAAVERVEQLVPPGTVVSPPPKGTVWDRYAYATAVAGTAADCRDALDAVEAALGVRSVIGDVA